MKTTFFKKTFVTTSTLVALGYAVTALAHSGGATIDPGSSNASATDLAAVSCSNDGNGQPHHLFGRIKDLSAPGGPLLSFHIHKGNQMTTTTDTSPGDDFYSPEVVLNGGPGTYYISATKTGAGRRDFDVIWHCMTADDIHTGTDITVLQFQ
jgi:hypothetical protein